MEKPEVPWKSDSKQPTPSPILGKIVAFNDEEKIIISWALEQNKSFINERKKSQVWHQTSSQQTKPSKNKATFSNNSRKGVCAKDFIPTSSLSIINGIEKQF